MQNPEKKQKTRKMSNNINIIYSKEKDNTNYARGNRYILDFETQQTHQAFV